MAGRPGRWFVDPSVPSTSSSDGPTARAIASAAIAAIGIRSVVEIRHRRPRHRDVVEADDRQVVGHVDASKQRAAKHADREDVRGGHDRRRSWREAQQCTERRLAALGRVRDVLDVSRGDVAEDLRRQLGIGRLPLADVAQEPTADEGDPSMAQVAEMLDARSACRDGCRPGRPG